MTDVTVTDPAVIRKKDRILVIAGAGLFQLAFIGLLFPAHSTVFAAIRAEFGLPVSHFSSFNAIRTLSGAMLSAGFSWLFFRWSKPLTLFIGLFMSLSAYVLMTLGPNTWIWYLASVLMSVFGPLTVFPIPYVLRQWFPERSRFLTGIVLSVSGAGGMVFAPLITRLTELWGWRKAVYLGCGAILLLGSLGIFFMFRHRLPPEKEAESAGIRKRPAFGKASEPFPVRAFLLCASAVLGSGFFVQFSSYMSIYGQSFGYTLMQGAFALSMGSLGNILGKQVYGWLGDRFGTWRATAFTNLCVLTGMTFLAFSIRIYALFLVGAMLIGAGNALSTIAVSCCSIAAYGAKQSERYVGLHTGLLCAVSAGVNALYGLVYDTSGEFRPVMILAIGIAAYSAIITSLAARKEKRESTRPESDSGTAGEENDV